MMVYATSFLSGMTANGEYSKWDTSSNLSKAFVSCPDTLTVWIPLHTVNEDTGGRLWLYTGDYLDSMVDMLKTIGKKTQATQYVLLSIFKEEMDEHKIATNCDFGDGVVFWDLHPHIVDELCKSKLEVLSVRLVKRGSEIDHKFLKEVEEFPEDGVVNIIEKKPWLQSLSAFLEKVRVSYEKSVEIDSQLRESK